MLNHLIEYIVKHNVGDIASILGVLIAITGFLATIYNVIRSKNAALKAEAASRRVRESFFKYDAISECSEVISQIGEIKRLQRGKLWAILPDRYSSVNRLLFSLHSFDSELKKNHKIDLQSAIQQFANLEEMVDRYITKNKSLPPDMIVQINKIVNQQLDRLYGIQNYLKHHII